MKKVAIYLRKSRGDIDDLLKHEQQLIKLCEDKGYKYDLYKEIASSDTMERKELTLLLNKIKEYDKIIVTAIDRLSRNEYHQALITQIFKENNIEIITPNKSYNFNNETDIITSDFEKLLARQEFRIIKSRLKAGKINSFNQGNWITGTTPFPYKYNRETKSLEVVKEDYQKYRYIVELALRGLSPRIIADKTGFYKEMIRRMLASKVHLGYVKYGNQYLKGKHQAVISEEEFKLIEKYKKGRLSGTRRSKHVFTLSGILKCGGCGYTRGIKYREEKRNPEAITKCQYCKDNGFITVDLHKDIKNRIEEKIDRMQERVQNNDFLYNKNFFEMELKIIEAKILKVKKQQKKLKEMILNDILTIEEGQKKDLILKKELKANIEAKELMKKAIVKLLVLKDEKITMPIILKVLKNNITAEEVNALYKMLINKIIVKDKSLISIEWK